MQYSGHICLFEKGFTSLFLGWAQIRIITIFNCVFAPLLISADVLSLSTARTELR